MNIGDQMNWWVESLARAEMVRLEQEAEAFVKMGYGLDELTMAVRDDGFRCVSPRSCLPEA